MKEKTICTFNVWRNKCVRKYIENNSGRKKDVKTKHK